MDSKQLGKYIRKLLDPIVDRKNLPYNDKHSYNKRVKRLSDKISEEFENQFNPFVYEFKMVYSPHEVETILDLIKKYKKKGFRIKDFQIATEKEKGYYFLSK